MKLTKKELKRLGELGKIPGPKESEEAFVKRIDSSLKEKNGKNFEKWDPDYSQILGAKPDWIPLLFSNKKLLPWQGAALWECVGEKGEKIPLIQLRKGFAKGSFLFYSKEEVLMHETVHALRIAFNEPRFEEMLAYHHSKSKWRRWIAPLFRSPAQTLLFISLIFISLAIQTTSLFFLSSPFLPYIQWVALLPFADLTFRLAILLRDHRILKKALQKLSEIFPNQTSLFPIAIRLKDSEIQKFATEKIEKLLDYIEEEIPRSVRWRQILAQFS